MKSFRKFVVASILMGFVSPAFAKPLEGSVLRAIGASDEEIKIVEHDVFNAEDWIVTAWKSKVESCKNRMINEEQRRLIESNQPVPKRSDIIKLCLGKQYKSRRQRENESTKIITIQGQPVSPKSERFK